MDELEFFRSITLKICGHLKIEEGLRRCIEYLSQHMPADRLLLERHDHGPSQMRPLARASTKECERLDILLHLSKQAQATKIESNDGKPQPVYMHNRSSEIPKIKELLEGLDEPSSSVLWLPLIVENQHTGSLILLAYGEDRFEEKHANLFAMLREPFFIAMSNAIKHERVVDDNRQLRNELLWISGDKIIGADFGLQNVMRQVQQVAPTESIVMLTGETGVGKDVIANAIHLGSSRRNGPFIAVNCGAIPESLLDSELFGHEKGAFTGALTQHRGRFERAHKGTIFLDEIGEMPLSAQVRLLRVLENREIERIGGTKSIPIDIRVIAATNKNPEEMVKLGQFREDLWFRLNVFPISIPPLRERKSDIPPLLQHFINRKAKEMNFPSIPDLAPRAVEPLMAYHWPGNVRELQNVVERALILDQTGPLGFDFFNFQTREKPSYSPATEAESEILDDVISTHIVRILTKTNGRISGSGGAAEILGVNPNTLRARIKKLGITFNQS
mgnify:CR=1 FL=1